MDRAPSIEQAFIPLKKIQMDEGWVSLSLAPVGAACILDGITVAGREGRIVIRKCLSATLTGTPIFGRHQPFCAGVAGPVHKATLDAAAAKFG